MNYAGTILTFDLVEGEYGSMEARVEIDSDRFEGTMDVLNYDTTMPFTAERKYIDGPRRSARPIAGIDFTLRRSGEDAWVNTAGRCRKRGVRINETQCS